jgi:hypothetical protein
MEGSHFAHVEPWLNPEDIADLWYFEGTPDKHLRLERIFSAVPSRLIFAGHYHNWYLVTPDQVVDWNGKSSVTLSQRRFFTVIGALCNGQFAVFDTETNVLLPFNCGLV